VKVIWQDNVLENKLAEIEEIEEEIEEEIGEKNEAR